MKKVFWFCLIALFCVAIATGCGNGKIENASSGTASQSMEADFYDADGKKVASFSSTQESSTTASGTGEAENDD